ncbi:hypothetical protein BMETH_530_0 [methanotrophic bacterial endosymbiont of Bathymodiolus sp.]|nr:hypothetical protein BMETH_530_0 [methanotrophic bacterial endosymbiont of Bathymodiolus sp.]
MSLRNIGEVVQTKHTIRRKQIKQTIIDHLPRAGATLFGRLKNKINRPVKISIRC